MVRTYASSVFSRSVTTRVSVRTLSTTSRIGAVGSRRQSRIDSSGSGVGSQPVLKKDLRPVPAVPVRCTGSSGTVTPTSANGVGGGGGSVGEKVKRDGGKEGSIYASYRALPYNTKLVFWACGAMFATLGLLAADKLEELFPARNNKSIRPSTSSSTSAEAEARFITHPEDSTSEGKEKEERKSKLFSISVVDRS